MALKLITAPAEEPVTLAEAKLHLRVDHTADDALITALIAAAREFAEHQTERAFVTQTWELALDAFPADVFKLPRAPLASVTSIKYDDAAGAEQTLSAAAYYVDTHSVPGEIVPAYGTSWPDALAAANAVRVRYVAGYGGAAAVPAGIKQWMLVRIGSLYQRREEVAAGGVQPLPWVDRLLDPYRVWSV
jgi:uncharacterized phiE125 gp8 family phage protein